MLNYKPNIQPMYSNIESMEAKYPLQPNSWYLFCYTGVHRIIEWPGLKRTTMLIQFQPPAICRVTNQQPRLPRATSSLALNVSRDGASTASLDNLFQCFTTLWVKNLLLISDLNLPCLSLKPLPLVLSLSTLLRMNNSHKRLVPCGKEAFC